MASYTRTSTSKSAGDAATAAQYNALRTDLNDLLDLLFGADSPTDTWNVPEGLRMTGVVTPYAGSSAPTGWLIADGSAISRATYVDLFTLVGTTYGAGNGTTTFNLPNLKGKVPVGRDAAQTEFDTLSETGGAKTHTLITAEMPSHTHSYSYKGALDKPEGTAGAFAASKDVVNTTTGSTGGDGAHNNLQPYIVLNYIIKY